MNSEKLKVGGIGAGVVGSILAAHLAEAGAEIIITDLPHRTAQIDNKGLIVVWDKKSFRPRVKTVPSISTLIAEKPDIIFVSTKTWVLNSIMPEVGKSVSDDILILSVQNGIGTEDLIARYIPPQSVARMVVNYAGAISMDGVTTVRWFNPPNYASLITERHDPRLALLTQMLNSQGLTTNLITPFEIKKEAFLKTILNSALMPVCGILGLTMREAMGCRIIRSYALELVREGLAVAARLGYHYGEDCLQYCMNYLDKGGDHYPSMYVDLERKMPTEIEFLNGKIMELGRMFSGIELRTNRVFTSLVVAREIKNGSRKVENIPHYINSLEI